MKKVLLGIGPLVLLALLSVIVVRTGLIEFLRRGLPPVEELTFETVRLSPSTVEFTVFNGGPDPVTVAQLTIDEAFWNFVQQPSGEIPRLGRATFTLAYPWVQDEPHEIVLLTSTGLTFAHEIEIAAETPGFGARELGVFTAIGLYVGVIPVAIGLLWFPFLRALDRRWIHFMLALTGGLLVFLGVDALEEALEAARAVADGLNGALVVVAAALSTTLILQAASYRRWGTAEGGSDRISVAWLIAIGIGLHNFGEGLAISAAYSLGEAALGAFLIIGFMMHNTTEGLAIVAPIARDKPTISRLATLGAVAGIPTVFGAWLGGLAYSPMYAMLFLAIGAGAILQVVIALYRLVVKETAGEVWTPLNAGGVIAGLALMYATGLLIPV